MNKGTEIVYRHMDRCGVIGHWELLAANIDHSIAAAVQEEANLRRKAAAKVAHAIYDQLEKIGVSYTRGGDTLDSGAFRNDALAGLDPSDVAKLVELVRRWRATHEVHCPCDLCYDSRPLVKRLPK